MNRDCFVSARGLLLAISLIMIWQSPLDAQIGASGQPETLAKAFVNAINDRSVEDRKRVLHPKTAACITPETQPYFDWIFSRQLKYVIPANYTVKTEPYSAGEILPPEAKAEYPIRPTHILQIDYSTKPFSSVTILLSTVKEGQRWYEVLPCPRAEAVAMVRSKVAKEKELEARVKLLAAELREPFRTEIISLVKAGNRVDAIKKYAEASGEDLAVAKSVVELIAPEE